MLYVGFKPVEPELAEGVTEHELHPLVHQAFACIGQKAVVPQKRIVEGTPNQVVQIDDPNHISGVAVNDKKAPMGLR
jgi:hypothetical protein